MCLPAIQLFNLRGSKKVILGVPQREYLMALCSASRLFGSGCEGIHHLQLVAYYRALLSAPAEKIPSIKPGMTAAWYKNILRQVEEEPSLLNLFRISGACQYFFEGSRPRDLGSMIPGDLGYPAIHWKSLLKIFSKPLFLLSITRCLC